jgi:hypothetical protein
LTDALLILTNIPQLYLQKIFLINLNNLKMNNGSLFCQKRILETLIYTLAQIFERILINKTPKLKSNLPKPFFLLINVIISLFISITIL